MILTPHPPFDLRLSLRFMLGPPSLVNGRVPEPLLDHFVDGEYRRTARIQGEIVLYGVREKPRAKGPGLGIRILSGPRDRAARKGVLALVRRQFSTDLDINPYYRLAESDPVLFALARRFRGMRIPQSVTVFECLISAILEQQVSLPFAHQVKKALITAYGAGVDYEGYRYPVFPEPAALARTNPHELRKLQISGPKARYIIGISKAVLNGCLDLNGLACLPPDEARVQLLKWKGVGPWTAHYVGLRALGHLDSLPAADVGLQKAIQRFYGLRKQPATERVERLARLWTTWRSYATFYLWLTFWETPEWREEFRLRIHRERGRKPK